MAAVMGPPGPPLSPRRRSGRRGPTSKSPESPTSESTPRPPQNNHRPQLPSSFSNPSLPTTTNGRLKRPKQDDHDDLPDDLPKNPGTNAPTALSNTNGRTKRKGKEKEKPILTISLDGTSPPRDPQEDIAMDLLEQEGEEQSVTRCVCGRTGEDDAEAGEFMVQCETCSVWQHGLCMGYESESQVLSNDYYCEECRPDLHTKLLKKLSRRRRHSSVSSHPDNAPTRASRSHSPSHASKPAKKRSTMNSRDAAYNETLQQALEATAAEAAAAHPRTPSVAESVNGHGEPEEPQAETSTNGRKKRKRTDDDTASTKRTRSASTTSDRPPPVVPREETPVSATATAPKSTSMPAPPVPTKPSTARNRRGGGRKSAVQAPAADQASVDGDDVSSAPPAATVPAPAPPTTNGRRANNGRSRASGASRKQAASNANGESSRRNHAGATNGASSHAPASSRAYHNSHAYVASQQPLLTTWGLPDYLSHLDNIFPSDVPKALDVPGSAAGENVEHAMERGVKVKWPSKRMSVVDMNKRVRALVEWVGREQASTLERGRRREALELALNDVDALALANRSTENGASGSGAVPMVLDGDVVASPVQENRSLRPSLGDQASRQTTMTMMEELMEELIGFQERFGPGAKSKERDRRMAGS
ncbi:hypothetical protein OF83DRAFT_1126662 [Amylostereum chailletii]|nr:hypothetical protein OF83DRAFT_1126662 [Amylostereum chailletii]